jgi:hypothetical protein
MFVTRADVPAHLREGEFFSSLSDDETIMEFDDEVCKFDLIVTDDAGLDHLLRTLRFWQVCTIPAEAVRYILDGNWDRYVADELQRDLPDVPLLLELSNPARRNREGDATTLRKKSRYLGILLNVGSPRNEYEARWMSLMAARAGDTEVLLAIYENWYGSSNKRFGVHPILEAARHGHRALLIVLNYKLRGLAYLLQGYTIKMVDDSCKHLSVWDLESRHMVVVPTERTHSLLSVILTIHTYRSKDIYTLATSMSTAWFAL